MLKPSTWPLREGGRGENINLSLPNPENFNVTKWPDLLLF
jgi:hypothetical protein